MASIGPRTISRIFLDLRRPASKLHPVTAPSATPWLASSTLEKILEHRFVADLTTHLWCRGMREFDVLHPEVDAFGYDLVIECQGIVRHIQLKAMVRQGKRRDVGVSISLARHQCGCVVWMLYDPTTLNLGPFLWLGSAPGEPLPSLGNRVGRHTKGNAAGVKVERPGVRLMRRSAFELIGSIDLLSDRLFGLPQGAGTTATERQFQLLRQHLKDRPTPQGARWIERAHTGDLSAIPAAVSWDASVELAHLIDGYGVVKEAGWGDPVQFAERRLVLATLSGEWTGGPAELWASLFLEHRRWRMAGAEPNPSQREILDELTRALHFAFAKSRP